MKPSNIALLFISLFAAQIYAMQVPQKPDQKTLVLVIKKQEEVKYDPAIDAQDKDGKTELIKSIEQQKISDITALLSAKANPWIKDNQGRHTFNAAAEVGSLEIFRLLAKFHGDSKEWRGMLESHNMRLCSNSNLVLSPLAYLQQKNNYPCAFFLKNYHKYTSIFSRALMLGEIAFVDEVLQALGKNTIDNALTGNDLQYRAAVAQGAKKTKRDPYLTALGFSLLLHDEKLETYLLDNGARNPGNFINWTLAETIPLQLAIKLDNFDVPVPAFSPGAEHVNLALDEEISVDQQDAKGNTPLLWACTLGNPKAIANLIEKGANVDSADCKKQRSGLLWLVRMHKGSSEKFGQQITTSRFLPCLFLMVKSGADLHMKDAQGKNIQFWLSKLKTQSKLENSLINRTIRAKKLSHKKSKELLNDIYNFQINDMNRWRENDTKFDLSDVLEINKALVKENVPDGQLQFKSFYKKFIQ